MLIALATALVIAVATIVLLVRRERAASAAVPALELEAADAERARIERDLHDGAQQRLMALRIQIELAQEALTSDPAGASARLEGLGRDVDATIDAIRALARGIYPTVLESNGLPTALRAAALDVPLVVTILPGGTGRYDRATERAVYFCCAEALQNAAKHSGATTVAIALDPGADGGLNFEVRDDGCGFDPLHSKPGTGLRNMRERTTALGGTLRISSAPGEWTIVAGSVLDATLTGRAALPSHS